MLKLKRQVLARLDDPAVKSLEKGTCTSDDLPTLLHFYVQRQDQIEDNYEQFNVEIYKFLKCISSLNDIIGQHLREVTKVKSDIRTHINWTKAEIYKIQKETGNELREMYALEQRLETDQDQIAEELQQVTQDISDLNQTITDFG